MNDEIKEILYETRDLILYYAKDDEDYKRSVALFNVGKIEKILDYITNLQQENERLKEEKDNLYLDNTMLKMEKDIYKQGYEDLKDLFSILQNGRESNERI